MGKHRVVISGPVRPVVLERLAPSCDIEHWSSTQPIPRDTLCAWLADADGLFSSGGVRVDGELLDHGRGLRVVSQATVGYDNVDIEACTARGIPFGNTPGVLVDATADLTFGLLLSAARRIHEGWVQVKSGHWDNNYEIPFGSDLNGKTLGIVGMGDIGSAVARRAEAFGLTVLYHNRHQRQDDAKLKTTYVSFQELLATSDFIVVLVPLNHGSRGLFGQNEFAQMKSGVYFINAARGPIVDTDALYQALLSKRVQYAALDVTDPEPLPGDHPLLSLPNVLVTPHIGSATYETRDRMANLAVENLLAGLNRRPLTTCVNPSVNYSPS